MPVHGDAFAEHGEGEGHHHRQGQPAAGTGVGGPQGLRPDLHQPQGEQDHAAQAQSDVDLEPAAVSVGRQEVGLMPDPGLGAGEAGVVPYGAVAEAAPGVVGHLLHDAGPDLGAPGQGGVLAQKLQHHVRLGRDQQACADDDHDRQPGGDDGA